MMYHVLRLACIAISSLKTWEAVVDSSDQGQARKHMFLWLLTLTGLSIEPIADSIIGQSFPLYEGLKIVVSGWLVLSHFYISTPRNEGIERRRNTEPTQSNYTHSFDSPDRVHESGIHSTIHEQDNSLSMSTGSNHLDFGRFKRDLERRKKQGSAVSKSQLNDSSNIGSSRASSTLPPLRRSQSASRQVIDFSPFPDNTFTRPRMPAAEPEIIRARELVNPFTTPSTSATAPPPPPRTIRQEQDGWESSRAAQNSTPLGAYEFGTKPNSLKRPLSEVLSPTHVPRSGKDIRAMLSRASPLPSASLGRRISRPRRTVPSTRHQPLQYDYDPETGSNDGSAPYRAAKRKRTTEAGEILPQQSDRPINNIVPKKKISGHAAPTEGIRQTQLFSKPKPPGRNRTGVLRQQALRKEPTEDRKEQPVGSTNKKPSVPMPPRKQHTDPSRVQGSAHLERRMSNVREWIKDKNPSLISPPLSASSDAANNSAYDRPSEEDRGDDYEQQIRRQYLKRKAHRQLAPIRDLKRPARVLKQQAHQESEENRNGLDEATSTRATIYPQPSDSVPISTLSQQQVRQSRPTHVSPRVPYQSSLATRPDSPEGQDDQQVETGSFNSPVDWSRFIRPVQAASSPRRATTSAAPWASPHRRQQSTHPSSQGSSSRAFEKSPFRPRTQPRTPFGRAQASASTIDQEKSSGLSPLIKLRQSQLKQRQKEDFLGIMRKKDRESDDLFQFNETLDVWERGDDETLAHNAALEAEGASMGNHLTWDQVREIHPGKFSILGAPVIEESRLPRSTATRLPQPKAVGMGPSSALHLSSSLASASPQSSHKNSRIVKENIKSPANYGLGDHNVMSSPRRRPSSSHLDSGIVGGSNSSLGSSPANLVRLERDSEVLGAGSSSSPFRSPVNLHPTPKRNLALRRSLLGEFASAATEEEDASQRRERNPGLYTPSKKDRVRTDLPTLQDAERRTLQPPSNQRSPHKSSTPILSSRYIEVSAYPDDDNDEDEEEVYSS